MKQVSVIYHNKGRNLWVIVSPPDSIGSAL